MKDIDVKEIIQNLENKLKSLKQEVDSLEIKKLNYQSDIERMLK